MKTVYLGITGNIIHPRIINIINEDAKLGELTIGLLTDSAIVSHKRLPYLIYEQREKVVENIKGVSRVVPQEDWNYVPNLKKYKPDYIIHGDDWKSNYFSKIRDEVFAAMKEWGGEVLEIPYTQGINSTALSDNAKSIGTTLKRWKRNPARKLAQIKTILFVRHTKIDNCGGQCVLLG